jgi:hypothetical protein
MSIKEHPYGDSSPLRTPDPAGDLAPGGRIAVVTPIANSPQEAQHISDV